MVKLYRAGHLSGPSRRTSSSRSRRPDPRRTSITPAAPISEASCTAGTFKLEPHSAEATVNRQTARIAPEIENRMLAAMHAREDLSFQHEIGAAVTLMTSGTYNASNTKTIASGALVGDAFLKTAKDVEGGFDAMAEMLLASGGQFAGFASQLKGKSAVPAAPKIVMTGGQTFNVKQDFRDKDPDKIAVVFRRDIGRTVERRASARYSGPFGT